MATAIKASPTPPPAATGIRYCVSCSAIYRQEFQRCPVDGGTLEVGAADPWVGSTVGGQYVIDGLVGEGAMGRVYRAHRADLPDRRYAIKIMIGDYAATAQMRARFQLEAEHASKLAHPNVVGVIDYGATEHGVNYIVMDLVEGPSLGAIVQQGPMDPDRVIRLARQLCEGLDHAHGRGMIHRDFKPDNILVVGEGELEVARIADFGLALSTDTEVRLTTTGIVCTPAYAAPEQLRGQPIDHRVDLYALGTTMYEMLSGGQLPFNGDLDTTVRSKLMNDAPNLLVVAPKTPPALVSIVGRLLSSEPARRPRSAKAVLRALDGAVAAPRAEIRTEETAPLRPSATRITAKAKLGAKTALPVQVVEETPAETTAKVRARGRASLARRMMQLFACGITLGGGLAYVGLRAPDDVKPALAAIRASAEPALAIMRETAPQTADLVMPALALPELTTPAPAPAAVRVIDARPSTDVVVQPEPLPEMAHVGAPPPPTAEELEQAAKAEAKAKAKPAAKAPTAVRKPAPRAVVRTSAATHAPGQSDESTSAAGELAFDDEQPVLDSNELARRYGAIGRQLKNLDGSLGRENTDDLWDTFQTIRITEAMGSAEARDEAAAALALIQEAIVDRTPTPAP